MKQIAICILIILGLPFLIYFLSDFTGIGKKEGGFKVYDAISQTTEGQDLINKYKIKCVAKEVDCIAFIDTKRGETFFAYNIDHNNYYFYENIQFDRVPDDTVNKYHITPHFNWLESNGKYIVNTMMIFLLVVVVIFWLIGRK